MSLFKCENCGCVENTALCRYWIRGKDEPALCSECDPKGQMKWHNCFPKKKFEENMEDLNRIVGREMTEQEIKQEVINTLKEFDVPIICHGCGKTCEWDDDGLCEECGKIEYAEEEEE